MYPIPEEWEFKCLIKLKKMKLKLIICGLAVGTLSLAVHSCSKDYMEQYEANLELNSNMSRSMVADSSITFIGDIEQLTIGENTTPENTQRVDMYTYFYDANHVYTVYVNVRYRYTEDLRGSIVLGHSEHITGQSPLPTWKTDHFSATHISGRRFRIKLTGKLNLSPVIGGGNVGPEYFVNEEREVVL